MANTLTDMTLRLLRLHLEGGSLTLKGPRASPLPACTMEETLAGYRELAAAGMMYPVSGFAHGEESSFRLSDEGWARRDEFLPEAKGVA